jgi:carbamoyl-phosphate synthase small subunit
MIQPGYLVLERGGVFEGRVYSTQEGPFPGEVVFTTGMCGYIESLTDPSYAGQILVFTFPLIGNYGVPPSSSWESDRIQVAGVVVNESCESWSHHSGRFSFKEWLEREQIPLLTEVDTRSLTQVLRTVGVVKGVIGRRNEPLLPRDFPQEFLVDRVSICEKTLYGKGKKRLIVVDCGMKEGILRSLARYPMEVLRVPHNYDYTEESFDGIFLSNGPGDPAECTQTIEILQKAMRQHKPIFGICLGAQMLALAAGAKIYKLPFGHRGHNQPCIDLETKRCYITSQNHGYAIDERSLPDEWRVTFRNLNDGSVEGIAHQTRPFYSVQFHPEASPGPTDTQWFFERLWECLQKKY